MTSNDQQSADALKAQSLSLASQNRLDEAKALLVRLCDAWPDDADAWYLLSSINGMLDLIDEAGDCSRRVIALQPDHSEAHINLGNVLLHQGRPDAALAEYQTALRINPDDAGALCSLGNALSSLQRLDEAAQSYEAAIRLNPNLFEAYYNLGNLSLAQKRYARAVEFYQRAQSLNPNYAALYNNLGNALKQQGLSNQAIDQYRHAVQLNPGYAMAYNNLGILLKERADLEQAEIHTQHALNIQADNVEAYVNLGNVRLLQGRTGEAILCLQKALAIEPARADVHSALLMYMHYIDDYSPEQLLAAARDWAARYAPGETSQPPSANSPDPKRCLRIGYVSADFYNHPVGYLIEAVLAWHNKSRYETFCYNNSDRNDELTARLRRTATHWRDMREVSEEMFAEQIRRDGIDILIDLSGHTADNRLMVFARKAAPVQASWLGYFDTTGMDAIDYLLADRVLIPHGDERFYAEQVVRLPNAYLCFSPPEVDLQPNSPPALESGTVTFGCFNNNAKITKKVVACWSKLLHALPQAQLYLKSKPFKDATVRESYMKMFARNGITAERLRFAGGSPRDEFLAAHHEVDIALDPFPFNGCMTTIWALWMGVPVVNLRGDHYVARMGETILSNVGLPEYVTDTPEDYVAKVIALATDLPRLAALRQGLRKRLLGSPLCDGQHFTRHLEEAYRAMWTSWCRRKIQA